MLLYNYANMSERSKEFDLSDLKTIIVIEWREPRVFKSRCLQFIFSKKSIDLTIIIIELYYMLYSRCNNPPLDTFFL